MTTQDIGEEVKLLTLIVNRCSRAINKIENAKLEKIKTCAKTNPEAVRELCEALRKVRLSALDVICLIDVARRIVDGVQVMLKRPVATV
jgi:hypothetical protein